LDRTLGKVHGDLVRAHPNGHRLRPPERRPRERVIRNRIEACIRCQPREAKQLEDLADARNARGSELRLGRRESVARQSLGWDGDWLLVASQRGVFDLGSVAELNGDRVSEDIPQGPFTIARVVQILIRPTYEHADEIAVCRLGQVKDPRDLALSCTLRSDGNGLLMPKQVVQDELDRRLAGGPDVNLARQF
jgi:hypothetical protein